MNKRRLIVREESWDVGGGFSITRSRRWAVQTLMVEIHQDGLRGRGEGVPYRRLGETLESVAGQIEGLRKDIESGELTRQRLQVLLGAGSARNALDCALWDLEAKRRQVPVWQLAGLPEPRPAPTAFSISLDKPAAMASVAAENRQRPLLKLNLGGPDDVARVRAVRAVAPDCEIIVDANEAWTPVMYAEYAGELARLRVRLVEQPVPAGQEAALDAVGRAVPLCADESVHDTQDLPAVARHYEYVNIKLDKTGGLTEAIRMVQMAQDRGIGILLGCMMGTSLGIAPALLLAPYASVIDLDAPQSLTADRTPAVVFADGVLQPPPPELWG